MKIRYNKLDGVPFVKSPNHSGSITPKFIVMHYTAGYTAESAIATFKNPSTDVSAHLVLGLDGDWTQMVPFNQKAWHAGPSQYGGFRNLNGHSIGIEIVNYGYIKGTPSDPRDRNGRPLVKERIKEGILWEKHSRVGSGTYGWPVYTEAQLTALDEVVPLLLAQYPIRDIVSHEEIDTRGWKTDPGPAFPMSRYRNLLKSNRTDEEAETYVVTASSLNVRSGPSTDYQAFGVLRKNEAVTVKARENGWLFISFGEEGAQEDGWISARYAVPD